MSALSAAALAVALQCAHGVDPDLLAGFATVESARSPLVIHQNIHGTPGHSYTARTIDEAVRISLSLIAAGQSIDTGTFQINSNNLNLLQITLPDTFNTCRAAAAAARLLGLMSRYNSGSPTASLPYARRVVAAVGAAKSGGDVQLEEVTPPAPRPPEPVVITPGEPAPVKPGEPYTAPSWDVWGEQDCKDRQPNPEPTSEGPDKQ